MSVSNTEELLTNLKKVVDLVGATVGRHCEIAVHDLRHPEHSVVHVVNGHVTNRAVGQGIRDLLGILHSPHFQDDCLLNYQPAVPIPGKAIRSSTCIFRNTEGVPVAAVCMNIDVTEFVKVESLMQELTTTLVADLSTSAMQKPDDVGAMVDSVIRSTVESYGKPVSEMDKEDKLHIIEFLGQRGAFLTRGAVAQVADLLQVSRHSIYKYLQEIKRKEFSQESPVQSGGISPEVANIP